MKTQERPAEEISAQDESALLRHFVFVAIFRNFVKSSHRYLTQSYDDFGKGWEEDFYAWPGSAWKRNGSAIGGIFRR